MLEDSFLLVDQFLNLFELNRDFSKNYQILTRRVARHFFVFFSKKTRKEKKIEYFGVAKKNSKKMNLEKQKQRFQQIFVENSAKFGKEVWEEDPNFLFFVEIPASKSVAENSKPIFEKIQSAGELRNGFFVSPWNLHLTLALPGRLGVHFQGNEVPFMEVALAEICEKFSQFRVELGDLNCFPNAIFREILDPSGNLYELHESIADKIPFSQHPNFQRENFVPHLSFFYGGRGSNFDFSKFDRECKPEKMLVDRVVFGRARDENGKYRREILAEFELKK